MVAPRQHERSQRECQADACRDPDQRPVHTTIVPLGVAGRLPDRRRSEFVQANAGMLSWRSGRSLHAGLMADFLVVVATVAFVGLMLGLAWALERV
jgi:hypothetical protein